MSRLLPLVGFLLLAALFGFGIWWNTGHDPQAIASPLLDKPVPAFRLPVLGTTREAGTGDLMGKPYVLNVFGSWCVECVHEHAVLSNQVKALGLPLVGFNYKDAPEDAQAWLQQHGNPFDVVLADRDGRAGLDLGVYGAPETFIVDAHGVIRYKHVGPLTPQVVEHEMQRVVATLGRAP